MIGVPGLLVVGNHGLEWLERDADAPTAPPTASTVAAALDSALSAIPAVPGAVIERKGYSATVHYRAAHDPDAARGVVLDALRRAMPQSLELRQGRMSVELRPRDLGDKGTAAAAVVERHNLRGVVVMGDDLTDLDMFAAISRMRDAGRIKAAIVAVGGADREVPPQVLAAADAVLRDPAQAAELLLALSA